MKRQHQRLRFSPIALCELIGSYTSMTYALAGAYGMGRAVTLAVERGSVLSGATKINDSSHLKTYVNFYL